MSFAVTMWDCRTDPKRRLTLLTTFSGLSNDVSLLCLYRSAVW